MLAEQVLSKVSMRPLKTLNQSSYCFGEWTCYLRFCSSGVVSLNIASASSYALTPLSAKGLAYLRSFSFLGVGTLRISKGFWLFRGEKKFKNSQPFVSLSGNCLSILGDDDLDCQTLGCPVQPPVVYKLHGIHLSGEICISRKVLFTELCNPWFFYLCLSDLHLH